MKHRVQEWKKKHQDQVIIEAEVQQIRLHNLQLQQHNQNLQNEVTHLSDLVKELQSSDRFTSFFSNLFGGIKDFFRGVELSAYVLLLLITVNQFLKWIIHSQMMPYKLYALMISPLIIFSIYRLSKH